MRSPLLDQTLCQALEKGPKILHVEVDIEADLYAS
jgi:hypothetical protein